MSRIGQKPIPLPDKVKVTVNGPLVNIEGPRGKLKHTLPTGIEARLDGKILLVEKRAKPASTKRSARACPARSSPTLSKARTKVSRRSSRFRASVSRPRSRASCSTSISVFPTHRYTDSGRHQGHRHRQHQHSRGRRRQAKGRGRRRRHSRLLSAGALQGQGRALRRRADHPQGRQDRAEQVKEKPYGQNHFQSLPHPHARARAPKVKGTTERPRLAVNFSGHHIRAQVIDDVRQDAGQRLHHGKIADRLQAPPQRQGRRTDRQARRRTRQGKNITKVVFDRGGFTYHGKVKALADAARQTGLQF